MTSLLSRIRSNDEKTDQKIDFESMLNKKQPGLVKALELFRRHFGEAMGLAEIRIVNIVLPLEIKKLATGKLSYPEFQARNTIYALDNLIEKERDIVKNAFLNLGFSKVMSADYCKDREALHIKDRDIKRVLEEDAQKLKYSEFLSKHSLQSLRHLSVQSLDRLMKSKSYLNF